MRALIATMTIAACAPSPCDDPAALAAASQDESQTVPVEDATQLTVTGGVADVAPEAWFTYRAKAGPFHTIDPYVEVDAGALVACAYMACSFGACPANTTAAIAPDGHFGCCAPTPARFQIHGCMASTATVWMSVASTSRERGCRAFVLGYHW